MAIQIVEQDGVTMFFWGELEIDEPVALTTTVTISDGREIVAVSQRGNQNYIFTTEDLGALEPKQAVEPPKWLISLVESEN